MEKRKKKLLELWQYVEAVKPSIEKALRENLPFAPKFIETEFNNALEYIVLSDGKRLRPVLTMLGAEIVGGAGERVLPAAIAVEFVHTSSLIFDDLPCMDNARERRGKVSLHEKFGEDLAILVAIGLLNAAYGLVFETENVSAESQIAAHREMVNCIGASGLVGGQSVDLALAKGANSQKSAFNADEFETIRNLKTSSLMRMALRVGAILSNADEAQLVALNSFAELLGDAYQTSDDLLDLQEDSAIVSETTRLENFALERGLTDAKNRVLYLVTEAKNVLTQQFGETRPTKLLCQMADYIAHRES